METVGEIETRRTMTRNALLLGKSKRVDNRQLYLTVEGPTFQLVVEVDPDKQQKARDFAARLTTLARHLGTRRTQVEATWTGDEP